MSNSAAAVNELSRPRWWLVRVLRTLTPAFILYLGTVTLLLFLENRLLYHPVRAEEYWEAPPISRVEDVQLTSRDGTRIHAWWCPTADWKPDDGALLYCHGNAGNLSNRGWGISRWQEFGRTAVLIFDYPGYGKSGGQPSEAGCYAAADVAYDWLTKIKKVPAEKLLLYGGSLGGGVATDLATRKPHRALVLVSTFTSVPDIAQESFWWMPARWLVRNRFDNLGKIATCPKPIFIAHGTADRLVPVTHAERNFAAARHPKQFFRMEGKDHNDPPGPEFHLAFNQFLEAAERESQPFAKLKPAN
jgi:fermentation-respiration switch protein FrsA (DUF1100 family)